MNKKWIDKRLSELGKSKAELGRHLGLPHARITEIINGSREIKSVEINRIASFLNWEPNTILKLLDDPNTTPDDGSVVSVAEIRVEGVSHAGRFEDISLIADDEYSRETIAAPRDDRFPHAHQYALRVSGDSMNLRYPDGGYVICAAWNETGLDLRDGHAVHVERIRFASERETTIKIYREIDDKRWLYPDSTNKNHQPIEINGDPDIEIIIKGIILATYAKQVI